MTRVTHLAAALLSLATARAAAQQPPSREVAISVPECLGAMVDRARLTELLELELRAEGARAIALADAAQAELTLSADPCTATASVIVIAVRSERAPALARRSVHLSDIRPSERPRVLALAAAELWRTTVSGTPTSTQSPPPTQPPAGTQSRAPPTQTPAPARTRTRTRTPAPTRSPAPTQARPPAQTPARPVSLSVLAWARAHLPDASTLFGGRAAVALRPWRLVSMRVDAGVAGGSGQDPLGDVAVGLASAGLAALVTLYEADTLVLESGIGLELGWSWASGTARDAASTTAAGGGAVVATALARATAAIRATPTWALRLELEAGPVLSGLDARADDRTAGGVTGFALGLQAGLELSP